MTTPGRLSSIAFALFLTGGAATAAAAPIQWTISSGGNDHWYELTTAAMSWTAAEAEAVLQGGHLVSVNSAAEQAFLNTMLPTSAPLWIGLNDIAVEGTHVWTTGEALTYTNWRVGEPNGTSEDVVAMHWHINSFHGGSVGDWNDTPDAGTFGQGGSSDGPYFGVIETTAAPVPEPATLALLGSGLLSAGASLRRRRREARTADRS